MIHAASREALAGLREGLEGVTARFSTSDGLSALAKDLYAVAELLINQPRLRRALADPTTPAEGRADLAGSLFDGKLGASALQLIRDAVSARWSSPWDLVDALESIADEVLFIAAEEDGALSQIEDELFRFERILDAQPELAVHLDDLGSSPARRIELLASLVGSKVHAITEVLLEYAITSGRKHTVTAAIDHLLEAAGVRQNRSVAKVLSAVELTAAQQTRLAGTLSEVYGRPISVRIAVDPSVRGGLIVRVGDELIDGSVTARLIQARTALAG